MTDFQQGSKGADELKGKRVAAVIIAIAFVALHIGVFFMADHAHFGWLQITVTSVATIAAALVCIALWNDGALVEENKWPYLVILVLTFASLVLIGYTPVGLSL